MHSGWEAPLLRSVLSPRPFFLTIGTLVLSYLGFGSQSPFSILRWFGQSEVTVNVRIPFRSCLCCACCCSRIWTKFLSCFLSHFSLSLNLSLYLLFFLLFLHLPLSVNLFSSATPNSLIYFPPSLSKDCNIFLMLGAA